MGLNFFNKWQAQLVKMMLARWNFIKKYRKRYALNETLSEKFFWLFFFEIIEDYFFVYPDMPIWISNYNSG